VSATFVFDENVSPRIVVALKALDYPVCHCTDVLSRGSADEAVFAMASTHGYFLVTQDQNMSRKPHQRAAMLSHGLGVFIFTGKATRSNKEFALLIQRSFDEMRARAERTARPFIYGITDRRRFDRLDRRRR
jgi:predicted nuclease of predicted toxin-antitoxin system